MEKTDYVFADGNEEDLASFGKKLGFDKIIFAYHSDAHNDANIKGNKDHAVIFNSENEMRKSKTDAKFKVMYAADDLREVMERNKGLIFTGLEYSRRGDFLHHRNSMLNQVLCKIMNKNSHKIIYFLNEIIARKDKEKIFGRMKQNMMLAKKYKVDVIFATGAKDKFEMKPIKDMESLKKLFGA